MIYKDVNGMSIEIEKSKDRDYYFATIRLNEHYIGNLGFDKYKYNIKSGVLELTRDGYLMGIFHILNEN